MHEFALGQGHVPTRNALSPDLFPGGSSAGSAVSVAIGSSYGSIGTESAGSVRIPAALNGIVGIKPTFGRMSRYGVIPGNGSLDHMGILARSVKDAAFLLSALNGYDPKDVASLNEPQASFAPSLMRSDRPRVGVAVQMFADVDADGVRVAEAALDSLTSDGAELVEVSDLPVAEMRAVTEVLLSAEAAAAHRALLPERGEHYCPETRWVIQAGMLLPCVVYERACRQRFSLQAEVRQIYDDHDLTALFCPTVPVHAIPDSDSVTSSDVTDPNSKANMMRNVVFANLLGLPAISVPSGWGVDGYPVSVQFVGRPMGEIDILSLGASVGVSRSA